MRKEIILNGGWIFHKGDIAEPISKDRALYTAKAKPSVSFRALQRTITRTDSINISAV